MEKKTPPHSKQFGRYSLEDLKGLSGVPGHLRSIQAEVLDKIQASPDSLYTLLTPPFAWAAAYELPLLHLVGALIKLGEMSEEITELANQPDPQKAFIASAYSQEEPALKNDSNIQEIVALSYALGKSLDCLVTYNCYLNEMLESIRAGDDKPLFKAVRIDRTIISAPSIAHRITIAEIEEDHGFFKELGRAICAGPPKKSTEYPDLRFLLTTLEEEGVLSRLSKEEKYQLLVQDLGLYDDSPDAPENLQKFINRWRTSRRKDMK